MSGTAPAAEARRCKCGNRMRMTQGGGYYCANCDTVQHRELLTLPRLRTREDVRFNLYWWSKMDHEYGPLPKDVNTDDLYQGG